MIAKKIIGNGARHIRVQYCGGWGYRLKFFQAKGKLGQEAEQFTFHLIQDAEKTGNFEWHEFENSELEGEGRLVFSKAETGHFPAGKPRQDCAVNSLVKTSYWDEFEE